MLEGPFYAVKLLPGSLGTFAGLGTDASARVLEKLGFSWKRRALSDQPGRCSNGPMDRFELDRADWYARRGFGSTALPRAAILPEPTSWSDKRAEA